MAENETKTDCTAPEILYEGGRCLVACKPPGLLTQAPPEIDSMEVRIKEYLARRDDKTDATQVYLGVPHRLDRPASGAMVFGLNRRTTKKLSEQFERRAVKKTYWACTAGAVEPSEGTWRDYVRKIPDEARAEVVAPDHADAREAVLHYKVLHTFDWGSWLEVQLETGRTHQIRVQAASRGFPILGDAQYGSTATFGVQYEDQRLRAIALHARELKFCDPTTREMITITAPAPQAWKECVKYVDDQ